MTLSIKSTQGVTAGGSSSDSAIIAQINALIAQYPQIKDKLPAPGSKPPQQVLQLAQTLVASISAENNNISNNQIKNDTSNKNSSNLAFNAAFKANETLGKKLNILC